VRLLLVWGVLLAGSIALGARAYYLQFVEAPELREKARAQRALPLQAYVPRRTVVDRQGTTLAGDRMVYTLYAHPIMFSEGAGDAIAKVAGQLAPLLEGYTVEALAERFRQQETGIRVADDLSEETGAAIRALGLSGIDLDRTYRRYYPQGTLAGSAIGYVRRDDRTGQAGVEYVYNDTLTRTGETLQVQQAGNGNLLPRSLPDGALEFDDASLQLTLDLRLQRAAREALVEQMNKFAAKRGAAIVMDARDGALLALVSEPSFDPNRYYAHNLEELKTWPVADLYEPGSTFKPINVAIAIEAGAIAPNTVIYDPGQLAIGGWPVSNHDFHSRGGNGSIDIGRVLQVSSNVAMIRIMQRLSPRDFYTALQDLGMTEPTGTDLLGETAGHLKDEFEFLNYPIEPATAAFGQGISLTPLKLVQLHGAIANGGRLVTPHVGRGLLDADGNLRETFEYPERRVFSEATARSVLELMETVVTSGSGKSSRIPGYRIAGKTGTAQKASPGGYYSNAKIVSFVGIVPVDAPRYVALVVVDEPTRGVAFGSTVAAPAVQSILKTLVALEGVPPSSDPTAALDP